MVEWRLYCQRSRLNQDTWHDVLDEHLKVLRKLLSLLKYRIASPNDIVYLLLAGYSLSIKADSKRITKK